MREEKPSKLFPNNVVLDGRGVLVTDNHSFDRAGDSFTYTVPKGISSLVIKNTSNQPISLLMNVDPSKTWSILAKGDKSDNTPVMSVRSGQQLVLISTANNAAVEFLGWG